MAASVTAARTPRRELPERYYHGHFLEMLDFVDAHYPHVLLGEHRAFIDEFRRLPLAAQCLYVRLANRKGRVFALPRLRYPEIGPIEAALDPLRRGGWVGPPGVEHFDDLLAFLPKDSLRQALADRYGALGRGLRKSELIEFARRHAEPASFVRPLAAGPLLVQRRVDDLAYLLFLYFGTAEDGLSRFTMRDLGLVRTQGFTDTYEPRFVDREQALEHYYFAARLARLERKLPGEDERLLAGIESWPEPACSAAAALRDRLAYRLGRRAERAGRPASALEAYRRGASAKCSERVLRLLLAAGRAEDARRFLEACLDDPRTDEEWLFARDAYELKFGGKRTSERTDVLRASATLHLDESLRDAPEQAVVEWHERHGMRAFRVENSIWRCLFGLLFWDLLYGPERAALNSPFELLPGPLRDGSLYRDDEHEIEARLAALDDRRATRFTVLQNCTRHYGTPNGVFRWRRPTLDAVFALLDCAAPDALRAILRPLCRDYAGSRHGYPDLLVIDAAGPRFVEVKADGDRLRRNQLLRLEQLRAAGFRAEVLRVGWTLDPDQPYAVVDIETTGGSGTSHRVTEIGAVKLQNGRVVDRYSTLVNPGRAIPPAITRLTGISDAMVAGAPHFADIADEFAGFLAGSIFVAHNVAFDYRFLAAEFARLGREFRFPRLCTCASMRKLFPGFGSYSLAALCERFGISLTRHHRALCDAEAAAELLLIVNERRLERLAGDAA